MENRLTDEALKAWLREVFANQVHRNYPVVEFIKKVYKFSPSDIPKGRRFALPTDSCTVYGAAVGEHDYYQPLKQIFDHLLSQLYRNANMSGRNLAANFVVMGERQTASNTGAKLKPDFVFSTEPNNTLQTWISCLVSGEVKARRTKVPFRGNGKIDMDMFKLVCRHAIFVLHRCFSPP